MSIPDNVHRALSRLAVDGYWREDAKPVGEFWSGCTAEESESLNWEYYGAERIAFAMAELTKEPTT